VFVTGASGWILKRGNCEFRFGCLTLHVLRKLKQVPINYQKYEYGTQENSMSNIVSKTRLFVIKVIMEVYIHETKIARKR
jgi:hypothetical protein